MMANRVIKFQKGHLDFFEPRDVFDSEIDKERMKTLESNTFAYSVISKDKVIAIFGGKELWSGVGNIWAITSDDISGSEMFFHKTCLKILKSHAEILKLHRVQCTVKVNYNQGIKWIKSIGFSEESIMRKYGPDKADYYLFVREF